MFYPIIVTEAIFSERKESKTTILIDFTEKNSKKSRKKFGLAFDLGLKLIFDAPGK